MNNFDYKKYFQGKRITQMGLGILGRGVGDAIFLAECGAELTITDMKDEKALAPSIEKLKDFPNIKYTLGKHEFPDFENKDFVLKAAGVPLDSPYIAHAKEKRIPIEMDASLFYKLLPGGVTTIGVTGTRGKSTVTHLIAHILKTAIENVSLSQNQKVGPSGCSVWIGGNVRDTATLPLLRDLKEGDIVVLELDSWQLQGFGDAHISPHIAVFTAFMKDHMNYYNNDSALYFADKANIYKYQKGGDVLVAGEDVASVIAGKPHGDGDLVIAERRNVPSDWQPKIIGEHNLLNISCAIEACRAMSLSDDEIKKGVESFEAVEGRLQFVKEVGGVKIWNDNNATTPNATTVALKSLRELRIASSIQIKEEEALNYELGIENLKSKILNPKSIVLICGGSDKNLALEELIEEINNTCKAVIFLPGSGTEKLRIKIQDSRFKNIIETQNLNEAVEEALKQAEKNDYILFSPAFASFGLFKNEYDRNDQFVKIVSSL